MEYQLLCQPSFSVLEVELEPDEKLVAEAGSMAWMGPNIHTETSTRGGIWTGLKRAVFSGESFFQNTYTAKDGPGLVALAPGCAGDIVPFELDGELLLKRGAYLASEPEVKCDSKWGGFQGLFAQGIFLLRATGTGLMFFNSYGAIQEIQVQGDYLIDNGYAVAWEPTLEYHLTKAARIRSFLFSDQLLMRFTGSGRLWVQTRAPQTLANWVHPFRPKKAKNNN